MRQKERSERKAQAKAARAEQLKRGRELSGTRYERAQIFKELRHSQGDEVTLDRIFAELTLTTNGHQDQ